MAILRRLRYWLAEPVDPLRLRWIRRGFGALMVIEVLRYLLFDWIRLYFVEPEFHFSYPGFEWVQPFSMTGMVALFLANGVAAAALMWGIRVRFAAAVFTCGWCYTTLIDQTYYQNHWVLVALMGLFFALVGHEKNAQRWSHALLQVQVGVVYFFAGVAKLNGDWFIGQPMTLWLSKRADWAYIGSTIALPETGLALSWIGLAFDLFIVPLLLWNRTRWAAFWVAVMFHCSNAILFKIGIFPAMMMVLTTIFLPAHRIESTRGGNPISWRLMGVLAAWVAVQVLVPVRHWFIPGDVAWTEEGHRFSWRMKTRSKVGSVVFHALDTREGTHEVIDQPPDLTVHQYRKMATRPEMIRQYAVHLAAVRSNRGSGEWAVHADARASLNGRPARTLVDPTVDLVKAERSGFGVSWITRAD